MLIARACTNISNISADRHPKVLYAILSSHNLHSSILQNDSLLSFIMTASPFLRSLLLVQAVVCVVVAATESELRSPSSSSLRRLSDETSSVRYLSIYLSCVCVFFHVDSLLHCVSCFVRSDCRVVVVNVK